jgi:HSP20 family protein
MWSELNRLRDEMERAFAGNGNRQLNTSVFPALNLWADDGHLYVEAELPGFELSELEIMVSGDNQLTLKGERKPPQHEDGTWHRQERGYGSFSRMIELPDHVDSDQVSAEFKNGVLTITMPKREEAKPRRIEVKCK